MILEDFKPQINSSCMVFKSEATLNYGHSVILIVLSMIPVTIGYNLYSHWVNSSK